MKVITLLISVIYAKNRLYREFGVLDSFLSERVYIEGRKTSTLLTISLDVKIDSIDPMNPASSNICSPDNTRNEKLMTMGEKLITREIHQKFAEMTKSTLIESANLPEVQSRSRRDTDSNSVDEIIYR